VCDREAWKNKAAEAPKGLSSHWGKKSEQPETFFEIIIMKNSSVTKGMIEHGVSVKVTP
jgi:hypothetical protein